MGFFPEIWNDKTLEAYIRELRENQRVVNSVMDYTPFTLGKKAAGYNGPTLSGLTARTLPADDTDDLSRNAIAIAFDQKKGCVFGLSDIDVAQSDVNQLSELTAQAAEVLLEDYDKYILGLMVAGLSSTTGYKNTIADTVNHKLTAADIKDARKKLNLQKAPRRGRTMVIHPDLEGDLFDIPDFVSRDKIADTTAMKDGVIGRVLGFDVITNADVPKVTTAWATTAGDRPVALFYAKPAVGFGRQKEFESLSAPNALLPGHDVNIYSVYGAVVQKSNYIIAYRKDVA